jgi:hypothetical protein
VKLTPVRIVVVLAVLFAVLLALAFGVHEWRKANGISNSAYDVSKSFVRRLLAHPDTAKFSDLHQDREATSVKRSEGDFMTAGWVETADNGGTNRRLAWRCIVHPTDGSTWQLDALRVGDKTLRGSFPEDK